MSSRGRAVPSTLYTMAQLAGHHLNTNWPITAKGWLQVR
jgi:hypothetical protein